MYVDGQIQDVRIYDRALNEEEVKILYNMTNPEQNQRIIQSEDGVVYTKEAFMETL